MCSTPLVAVEKRTSAGVADGVSHVGAAAGVGGDRNDSSELEPVLGIGEKAREQQRDFARERESTTLAEQRESLGPVTVIGNEAKKGLKDFVMH